MPKETLDFGPPGKKRRVAGGLQGIAAANPGWLEQGAGWTAPRGGGWGGGGLVSRTQPNPKNNKWKGIIQPWQEWKEGKNPEVPFPPFFFLFPPPPSLPYFLIIIILLFWILVDCPPPILTPQPDKEMMTSLYI